MRPEAVKYLEDALQACAYLEDFSRGKSFADYDADPLLQSAVERQFITIGEALTQAEKIENSVRQSITAFREILGFEMVHGYAIVKNATVWGIMENDLSSFKQELTALVHGSRPSSLQP